MISEIFLQDFLANVSDVERGDGLVFRRVEARKSGGTTQQLLGNGIVRSVITILDVLVGEGIVRICGLLVAVWALFASFTLAFHPERADVRQVSLVVRRGAREFDK